LVTMTTLLTFGVLSFACFALKAGGAPSFRPSFRYFNLWTSGGGALACLAAMFFTNGILAFLCIVIEVLLFVAIHVFSPPKPWGDVTRNLHYHIVRKYLLRIDERKGHVKYWRPQILLLANNPRTEWNLIIFCNSLKKGALYVLGHIIKGDFAECLPELRRQQIAWLKLVDVSGIKSFVDVVIANDEREGARNLVLSCGLGGMRPNVVVLGFPSHVQYPARLVVPRPIGGSTSSLNSPRMSSNNASSESLLVGRSPGSRYGSQKSDGSEITIRGVVEPPGASMGMSRTMSDQNEVDEENLSDAPDRALPTDSARRETPIRPTTFVGIMEDTLALNKALAIAYNFQNMRLPGPVPGPAGSEKAATVGANTKSWFGFKRRSTHQQQSRLPTASHQPERFIDLWPIQIASPDLDASHAWDTYTMVLQLGTILSYTSTWKGHKLRVSVFVEAESDVEGERRRVRSLLENLRIPAVLRVFTLSSGSVSSYEAIVMGRTPIPPIIDRQLAGDPWWDALRQLRKDDDRRAKAAAKRASQVNPDKDSTPSTPISVSAENSQRQSKRDQKIFGVSLPPEHLAFFKHNMRIGLAHPRSRRIKRMWARSGEESESDDDLSDSEDNDSDLSDELANLGDEDEWFGAGSQGLGIRRSSTITHDPRRTNQERRQRSYSIGSRGGGGLFTEQPLLSSSTSSAEQREQADGNEHTNPPSAPARMQYGATLEGPTPAKRKPLVAFNELPNKTQYLILNELIRMNSTPATTVVLTALPAPEAGTSDNELQSLRYLEQLESLFSGGPPVLGVHARQLTMTMSL